MKRFLPLCGVFLLSLILVGCAYNRYPTFKSDYTNETWFKDLNTNPNVYAKGASRWFLTGDPNATELANRSAPTDAAMSTMMARVGDFTRITTEGSYQLQIFGSYGANSVYVYGPNDEVRNTIVRVKGDQLFIGQSSNASRKMRNVIIRVGISNLTSLTQCGSGSVEGIQLTSSGLNVKQTSSGNIYLAGNVNLQNVNASSPGSVSIFGARSQQLEIRSSGSGSVNVVGDVNLRYIEHHGTGNINVLGANSTKLNIRADGKGKIGLLGRMYLQELQAREYVCVYINGLVGGKTYVYVNDYAKVGIAGNVDDLFVYAAENGEFWGRYLIASNAFVRAQGNSHINVTATNKIFAAAVQSGTVYFFGEPRIMSQFIDGNGTIIPVWSDSPPPYRNRTVYKDEAPSNTQNNYQKEKYRGGYQGQKKATVSPYASPYRYRWVNGRLVSTSGDAVEL